MLVSTIKPVALNPFQGDGLYCHGDIAGLYAQ